MNRPLCAVCLQNPAAINYHSKDKTHYRKLCDQCIRKGKKIKPTAPAWFKSGYRKKERCEKCGFRAKYPEDQFRVFYLDGNLKNNSNINLKTICLNCQQEIFKGNLSWIPAGVVPDF
jgi:hypothetical protein